MFFVTFLAFQFFTVALKIDKAGEREMRVGVRKKERKGGRGREEGRMGGRGREKQD